MGYPPTLAFEKAPAPVTQAETLKLKSSKVILNALIGHLLHGLSNKRLLRDPVTGKPDALGISLPDDFAIRYNSEAIDRMPIEFDDPTAINLMMAAYDTMCDRGDHYSVNEFERTLQELLRHAHLP